MNRYDFKKLAAIRLEDAKILIRSGRYEGCYYLSGYIVECGLKACIAKLTKRYDFPDKGMLGAYTHNLTELLRLAKLEPARETEFERDREFRLNWYVVKGWGEQSRYEARQAAGGRFIQRGCRPQAWSAPMDKTTLVEPYIEEGRRFLKLLDVAGIRVNAALWQKDQFSSQWQLLIVTPLVEELGVKETYRRFLEILSKAPQPPAIDLLDVSVLTPEAWFYKSLRRELRFAHDRPLTKRPVGDHVVEDGFIYFVK